ncbi:TPA: hypothetical protein ACRZZI_004983 [Vibrio harveyi]
MSNELIPFLLSFGTVAILSIQSHSNRRHTDNVISSKMDGFVNYTLGELKRIDFTITAFKDETLPELCRQEVRLSDIEAILKRNGLK